MLIVMHLLFLAQECLLPIDNSLLDYNACILQCFTSLKSSYLVVLPKLYHSVNPFGLLRLRLTTQQ